jgi:membrane protein required for beta-lactamase induction
MADENEHAERASDLLSQMDPSGPNYAQVEAMLAVAYELRTANLIALQNQVVGAVKEVAEWMEKRLEGMTDADLTPEAQKSFESMAESMAEQQAEVEARTKEIRTRLGIPES